MDICSQIYFLFPATTAFPRNFFFPNVRASWLLSAVTFRTLSSTNKEWRGTFARQKIERDALWKAAIFTEAYVWKKKICNVGAHIKEEKLYLFSGLPICCSCQLSETAWNSSNLKKWETIGLIGCAATCLPLFPYFRSDLCVTCDPGFMFVRGFQCPRKRPTLSQRNNKAPSSSQTLGCDCPRLYSTWNPPWMAHMCASMCVYLVLTVIALCSSNTYNLCSSAKEITAFLVLVHIFTVGGVFTY